jgi:hypothetical protein
MLGTGDVYADDIGVDDVDGIDHGIVDADDADDGGIVYLTTSWIWKRPGGFHSSKKRWSSGWITMKFGLLHIG